MARGFLAHSADPTTWSSNAIVAVLIVVLVVTLVIEHTKVKHGEFRARHFRNPLALGVTFALAAVIAPSAVATQDAGEPVGLPDLISDRPFIWFVKNLELPGGPARVMAFDGYLHNIGSGKLDLLGNPQLEGGVKQRVFDGENWEEVGSPTVRFETDDGHNHFHLIRAADYALWDEARKVSIGDASKVGFCLIDTEQIEDLYDAFYDINDTDYCGVEKPDATFLSMGISPGWRDTYDANTTLQWVDISNVKPGRYWVTAETDVNNEIVESNEDNNGIVFSFNKHAVPGYVARELELQNANEDIRLLANAYGTVGERMFVVEQGPANGTLNVPLGVDLHDDTLTYTPDPGFVGQDSFRYFAHDVSSQFPFDPTVVEVTILVEDAVDDADTEVSAIDDNIEIVPIDDQQVSLYEQLQVPVEMSAAGEQARWYARDLPTGLQIDPASGLVTGVPIDAGEVTSTVVADVDGRFIEATISWQIDAPEQPTLHPINPISTTSTDRARVPIGRDIPDIRYEADGAPPGTQVTGNAPQLIGTPEEIGDFDIEIRELTNGEVTNTIRVTWHVRPSVHPAFPL